MLSLLRMMYTGTDVDEPDDGTAQSDVSVCISVPEEFLGASIQELTARGGLIESIEKKEGVQVVNGELPARQFADLSAAILAFDSGRCAVELRDKSQNDGR